ncbi:VOC family protein [Schaalia sp. 19OD2882]|nr:VOC family protein [Schaalia sp. 19OD2882]
MPLSTPSPPTGHNTINPFAIVPDAIGFIRFVEAVFDGHETTQVRTPDRDGSIIHAEVVIGDSTIMLSDRKPDWPFTPAFLQVYVSNARMCLDRAVALGAEIVTPVSDFYGGCRIARLLDPWRNLWWLYEPTTRPLPQSERVGDTEWHDRKPSLVYTTLMDAMRNLTRPEAL